MDLGAPLCSAYSQSILRLFHGQFYRNKILDDIRNYTCLF